MKKQDQTAQILNDKLITTESGQILSFKNLSKSEKKKCAQNSFLPSKGSLSRNIRLREGMLTDDRYTNFIKNKISFKKIKVIDDKSVMLLPQQKLGRNYTGLVAEY